MPARERPDRNLAMELVRVTESAALAAARWVGRGDKNAADGAAVDAMRNVLDTVSMDGIVVIGEGEKDEAPMLYNGERVGNGSTPNTDVAVDPIDGTTLTSLGRGNALSVIAVSERGSMFNPGPCVYMDKIAVGPEAAHAVDLDWTPTKNLQEVASPSQERETVEDITDTVFELSSKGFGALIAIERDINLKGFVETGVPIDAKFTKELILTIFHPKTVLHDGGLVVSGDRIVAAACIFPLTQREDLDRNLGLRHRAGLGLSEESDAITLVVSEETGQVSICHSGRIERNLGVEKFRLRLSQLLFQEKYESDPAQPLASEADQPDSGLRPVVSHQAERRPDTGAA